MRNRYTSFKNGNIIHVGSVDDICNSIRERIESAEDAAERAQEQMREMRDEKWKDKELQAMKEQLDAVRERLRCGFGISKDETNAINAWKDQHWTNRHNAPDTNTRMRQQGAIGGSFEYKFVPTSIGTAGSVCCATCMEKARREAYKICETDETNRYWDVLQKCIKKYDAEFEFQEL